MKTTRIK